MQKHNKKKAATTKITVFIKKGVAAPWKSKVWRMLWDTAMNYIMYVRTYCAGFKNFLMIFIVLVISLIKKGLLRYYIVTHYTNQ